MFPSLPQKASAPPAVVPAALRRIHSDARWRVRRLPAAKQRAESTVSQPRGRPLAARRPAPSALGVHVPGRDGGRDSPRLFGETSLCRKPPPPPEEGNVFTLYDTATGSTCQVTAEEFLPAALACEMDLSAPEEALKAQAVALYSFYSYQRAHSSGEGADFACDTANWLVYVPQSSPWKIRWGEDFASLYVRNPARLVPPR